MAISEYLGVRMKTPMHSINIDFSHSSEAKALLGVLGSAKPSSLAEQAMRETLVTELMEAVELLESIEV